jgi:hypothetical protein
MSSRLVRVLPALALATLLVGCGGPSNRPSTNTAKSTANVSVVARAEAICQRKGVLPPGSPAPSLAADAAQRDRSAHELTALNASGSLATGYRRLASLIAEEASLYRRLGQLSRDDSRAALAILRQLRRHPAAKQALLVGLGTCA